MSWTVGGEQFDYRLLITVDKDKVPGNQTNFPVYVDLSDLTADFWTNVKSDGGDIRITQSDGTTQQAVDLVYITSGSSIGELHFKASSLSSSLDTSFYIYYGNASASQPARDATYGSDNVWSSSEYHNVFHFESKTGDTDSSSYQNNWVAGVGCTLDTGKLSGNGMSHNGSTDYGQFATGSFGSNSDLITVELWHKSADTTANAMIFGDRDFATNQRRFDARVNYAGVTGSLNAEYYDNNTPTEKVLGGYVNADIGMKDNAWQHIMITHDNPNNLICFYVDSVLQTTTYILQQSPDNFADFTRVFLTGAWNNAGTAGLFHSCVLDEFRLSTVLRDQNYATTAYNNQNSPGTFYTVGDQEVSFIPRLIFF